MKHEATSPEKRAFNHTKKLAFEAGLTTAKGGLTKRGYRVAVLLALTDPNIAKAVLENA